MKKLDFEKYWNDTKDILIKLAGKVSQAEKDSVKDEIDRIKVKELVGDMGKKLEALLLWAEQDRNCEKTLSILEEVNKKPEFSLKKRVARQQEIAKMKSGACDPDLEDRRYNRKGGDGGSVTTYNTGPGSINMYGSGDLYFGGSSMSQQQHFLLQNSGCSQQSNQSTGQADHQMTNDKLDEIMKFLKSDVVKALRDLDPQMTNDKLDEIMKFLKSDVVKALRDLDPQMTNDKLDEIMNVLKSDVVKGDLDHQMTNDKLDEIMNVLKSDVVKGDLDHKMMNNKLDEIMNVLKSDVVKGVLVTNVEIIVKNCNKDQESVISQHLDKLLNSKIEEDTPEKDEDQVKILQAVEEAMSELLSGGRELIDVYQSCIILVIKCPTFENMKDLGMDCMTGKMTRVFKTVETYIRELTECPTLELEVGITNFAYKQKVEHQSDLSFKNLETRLQGLECDMSRKEAFGNVLYYNMGTHTYQDDMSDPSEGIILTPQWIINVFKAFVTHKDKANEMNRIKGWQALDNFGYLRNDLIIAFLQQNNFLEDKDNILMYMEYLKIIAKPVDFRAEKDKDSCTPSASSEAKYHFLKSPTIKLDVYIMPCMLPARPKVDMLKKFYEEPDEATHYTPTLCMYIKKGLLPAFVLHHLVATAMKEMPIAVSNGRKLLFNGLGSFDLTEKRMLTIWSMENIIHLSVTFKGACKGEKDEIAFCKALRGRFEKLVLEVFNFHGKYTYDETNKAELFNLYIKCPGCEEQVPFDEKKDLIDEKPVDYMISLHSVEYLSIVKEKSCGCCKKVITAEHALKWWFAIDKQPVDTREFTQQQKEILGLDVNCCQLVDLEKEITSNVHELLLQLNFSDQRIQRMKTDNPDRWVYCILHDWKKRGEGWEMLYNAMKHAGLETEHLLRIIQGEDSPENKKTINKYMEEIKKGRDDILVLTDIQMVRLSLCIGKEYWFFGIRLGITETEMQQIYLDSRNNMKEQVRTILCHWNRQGEPIRKFIRSVVLSCCDWPAIQTILIDD